MPQPKIHPSRAARQAAHRTRQAQARIEQLSKGLPPLPAIATLPGNARWNAAIRAAHALIACTLTEMQGYFDDRSETWQESKRGEEHQDRIAYIDAAHDAIVELMQ